MKPKAYSYLRFATPDQIKGDSKRRQLKASRDYADKHNLDLVEEYEDLGVSAYKGKHATEGALSMFIAAVQSGDIPRGSYLLAENLDRISREKPKTALARFLDILGLGINVVTLMDGKVYTDDADAMDLMYSLMIMGRAHEESQAKSKRLSNAWKNKQIEAAKDGTPKTARAPAWLKLSVDRKSFVVIEDKAAVVRRIYGMTVDGLGRRTIARTLNLEGVPPLVTKGGRAPKAWHPSTLQKLLTGSSVIGTHTPTKLQDGKRVLDLANQIEDYYPAVIDKATFGRAQKQRIANTNNGGRAGATFANIAQGFARCSACGSTMRYVRKNSRDRYLQCSSYLDRFGCAESKSWRYQPIQNAVIAFFCMTDVAEIAPPPVNGSIGTSIERLEVEVEQLANKISDLLDNFSNQASASATAKVLEWEATKDLKLLELDKLKTEAVTPDIEYDRMASFQLGLEAAEGSHIAKVKINRFLRSKVTLVFTYDVESDRQYIQVFASTPKADDLPIYLIRSVGPIDYVIWESETHKRLIQTVCHPSNTAVFQMELKGRDPIKLGPLVSKEGHP